MSSPTRFGTKRPAGFVWVTRPALILPLDSPPFLPFLPISVSLTQATRHPSNAYSPVGGASQLDPEQHPSGGRPIVWVSTSDVVLIGSGGPGLGASLARQPVRRGPCQAQAAHSAGGMTEAFPSCDGPTGSDAGKGEECRPEGAPVVKAD
jgi:hypothetical protein